MDEDQFQAASKILLELASGSNWRPPADSPLVAARAGSSPTTDSQVILPDDVYPQLEDEAPELPTQGLNFILYTPHSSSLVAPSVLHTTTNLPSPSSPHTAASSLTFDSTFGAAKKRKKRKTNEHGTPTFRFVPYDISRLENKSDEPPKKRNRIRSESPGPEPAFKCMGCRKVYLRIEDHFRKLRRNSPCHAHKFQLKSNDGQWGQELSYNIYAQT
ncbi:hypothetical protein FB451DRAFT_407012 [Mycena latifolia]|nr:hypothetical protein FB451DRAFT_407012 [Mycena latifolia]